MEPGVPRSSRGGGTIFPLVRLFDVDLLQQRPSIRRIDQDEVVVCYNRQPVWTAGKGTGLRACGQNDAVGQGNCVIWGAEADDKQCHDS